MERTVQVIKPTANRGPADATDIALLVSTSSKQRIDPWDRGKISGSLVKETDITPELAEEIAAWRGEAPDRSTLIRLGGGAN